MIKKFGVNSSNGKSKVSVLVIGCVIILMLAMAISELSLYRDSHNSDFNYWEQNNSAIDENKFNILASSENKDLEEIVLNYAKSKGYDVNINYAGTLEVMDKINNGEKYDSIFISNSIWAYMIDSKVATLKNSKATSITPVIFGIKKSKAEELGFVNKTIYTKDLVDAISSGKLKFTMANPTITNSGASAYLGLLYTLAGNPEVLTEEILNKEDVRQSLKTFFSGLERSSGSEDFLEEAFLKGDYEAVVSYESSIIKINKELESKEKETLYAVYPVDGVSICDNPFIYIDNKNDGKKNIFTDIQSYLLSDEGQKLLQEKGRRTWLGGINKNANKNVFNPKWGIDTDKYITPVKYPNASVIKQALGVYQTELRKPVHVVFCLDYSGSMYGDGMNQLRKAMQYILSDEASKDYIQFSEEDKIDVIMFSSEVRGVLSTDNGLETDKILERINNEEPYGSTALYYASAKGIETLKNEDANKYNLSVILMTDGIANIGTLYDLEKVYKPAKKEIPIYSIMFGEADDNQLEDIAKLTNGKVFDGKEDLVAAFKKVRGYN